MSMKGVIQGVDENGDPKQVVMSPAVAAAVERLLVLLAQYPYLLHLALALLNKYSHYPCPRQVTEDYSTRHLAEMIVHILAFHGHDHDLLSQYPAAVQVIQEWSCRIRTPDQTGIIDAMVVKLMSNPPLPTFSFTDKYVVRFTVILLNAIGVVQGGRDTSLAAEAVFQQLPLLPQAMVPASSLSAPPASYLPPSPYPPASARPFHLDDRNTHERHREQFGDADQRGQRSRSHRDRSPARQRRPHTEQSPPDRRSRSRSRGRHHPDRRHRSYSASPSSPRWRRSRSRSSRSRSPRPTRSIRQPPTPILGPPSKFATDCLAGVGTPFPCCPGRPERRWRRDTTWTCSKLIAATAARAQVFSGGGRRSDAAVTMAAQPDLPTPPLVWKHLIEFYKACYPPSSTSSMPTHGIWTASPCWCPTKGC